MQETLQLTADQTKKSLKLVPSLEKWHLLSELHLQNKKCAKELNCNLHCNFNIKDVIPSMYMLPNIMIHGAGTVMEYDNFNN